MIFIYFVYENIQNKMSALSPLQYADISYTMANIKNAEQLYNYTDHLILDNINIDKEFIEGMKYALSI